MSADAAADDLRGDLLEGAGLRAVLRLEDAVLELDVVRLRPATCGARRAVISLIRFLPASCTAMPVAKVDAAAGGDVVVADGVGVDDGRLHVLEGDAQRLGELHRERRARAADVGVALDEVDGAVRLHADVDAGAQADVEPEAGGDAAAAVRAFERRVVVRASSAPPRGTPRGRCGLKGMPIGPRVPFVRGVHQPELQRVHAQLLAPARRRAARWRRRRRARWARGSPACAAC